VYPTQKAAVDALVNVAVVATESVVRGKLGKPLGVGTGGNVLPELSESRLSDNALDDIRQTLAGIATLYKGEGGTGKGLSELVKARNANVDGRVVAALAATGPVVDSIPPPLRVALAASPEKVRPAYDATLALKRALSTEVASLLGTTIEFNSNDGD
jgi:predicted lipoprotein